jgi:hypothetical protein
MRSERVKEIEILVLGVGWTKTIPLQIEEFAQAAEFVHPTGPLIDDRLELPERRRRLHFLEQLVRPLKCGLRVDLDAVPWP